MNSHSLKIPIEEKFIDIGTHKLRVKLSDISSDYTIILESGGGANSDAYNEVQDPLANTTQTRVISYDRSGFGLSELGPTKFNAIDEINALKTCLEIQGLRNNYILVGHSYGGLLAQLFTAQYPELVKGLVLIDPMNVLFVDTWGYEKLNAITPHFDNPSTNSEKAGSRMVNCFIETLGILREKRLPKNIPVILITAGKPIVPGILDIWRNCHQDLVNGTEKHKMIIAEDIGHDIPTENPEIVLNTIIELVNSIKLA